MDSKFIWSTRSELFSGSMFDTPTLHVALLPFNKMNHCIPFEGRVTFTKCANTHKPCELVEFCANTASSSDVIWFNVQNV